MTNLKFYRKNMWGSMLNYLVECPEANILLDLLQSKTVSSVHMNKLAVLGITFTEVIAPHD